MEQYKTNKVVWYETIISHNIATSYSNIHFYIIDVCINKGKKQKEFMLFFIVLLFITSIGYE